jgi:hypothetical protein
MPASTKEKRQRGCRTHKKEKAPTGIGALNVAVQKRKASSVTPGRTLLHREVQQSSTLLVK